MKKSKWMDCQGNEFFPKQKGTPSLVKIEHKNTATLDSARSKKKSKVAVLQLRLHCLSKELLKHLPGRVAQSVTCLATDASLTADPGVGSLIPALSHTFVEIDYEIIYTVILLPSAESFKKDFC